MMIFNEYYRHLDSSLLPDFGIWQTLDVTESGLWLEHRSAKPSELLDGSLLFSAFYQQMCLPLRLHVTPQFKFP